MAFVKENYDVVVVGAGHAGCEAALACARLGLETILFTISVDSIAMMPCTRISGEVQRGIWSVRSMHSVERWEKILIRLLFSQRC